MRLSVRNKILGAAGILVLLQAVGGVLALMQVDSVNAKAQDMYANRSVCVGQMGDVLQALDDEQVWVLRGYTGLGDAQSQASADQAIAADENVIAENMSAYGATSLEPTETSLIAQWDALYPAYQKAREAARQAASSGETGAARTSLDAATAAFDKVVPIIQQDMAYNQRRAAEMAAQVQAISDVGVVLAAVFLAVSLLVGAGTSFWISRGIVNRVRAIAATLTLMTERGMTGLDQAMARFAQNDLTYPLTPTVEPIGDCGTDEIGQIAEVTNASLAKLQSAMRSYETARASLAGMIREVKTAAEAVARSSSELNLAATQAGTASSQIATTINQVAVGAADQAKAASISSGAVQELTAVISQVEGGAGETEKKVQVASLAIDASIQAISRATVAADELKPINVAVHEMVVQGLNSVEATAEGMTRIRAAVADTTEKVTGLGAKGERIGAIVETIDDIAEQTNLLALNAAIEAARAGEQGKGFAVVADEVRQLAERSSRATKEIASLIAEVQLGTADAVKAMEVGAAEVETGAGLAQESAVALRDIAESAKGRDSVMARVFGAIEEVGTSTASVLPATDAIAQIAGQTSAAAERMSAAAASVFSSVESIAAVSEENSAAAEEVSASTEEMSAQAEEVVASAQSLADMARELDALVARFTLEASEGNVVQRRRGSDWRQPGPPIARAA
jgi:methyl-accepting chemotaxis protein